MAASHRPVGAEEAESNDVEDEDENRTEEHTPRTAPRDLNGRQRRQRLLPYRAGYETDDRNEIQQALSRGQLVGVVSTSALELGLDIGEIDLVVMLNVPASTKAFWQRLGRTGRRRPGVCLLIDTRGALLERSGQLGEYLRRPAEPSWLYLDNRYIQYANALCAASELRNHVDGGVNTTPYESLPESFRRLFDNELNPTEAVPSDLYPLKQKGQADPHRAFPIRSGIEQGFQVKGPHGRPLGSLTFPQLLREAYPGAIYYYMARPYRAYRHNHRRGEVLVRREKRWTTRPLAQSMVFPRFDGGVLNLWRSPLGFVAEVEMQVSQRVLGFIEQRGATKEEHPYGPTSPYYQRELNRFFETTGICWYFPEWSITSGNIASGIMEAYCAELGVQARDLGVGPFHSKASPLGHEKCQGMCVFDATSGSLRLTQGLGERFVEILGAAAATAGAERDFSAQAELTRFAEMAQELRPANVGELPGGLAPHPDWVEVIAPGQKAMFRSQSEISEVNVMAHCYTPQGMMYELTYPQPGVRWTVTATHVEPLYGETAMLRLNLVMGVAAPAVP